MLRINRGKFIGLLCLTVFIYFIVFTDSGSSTSNFRANTEAGIAKKSAREKDLPLRGSLSDEDLTKKTNDELQGILNTQSQERLLRDRNGNPIGRGPQGQIIKSPSRADPAAPGASKEDSKKNPVAKGTTTSRAASSTKDITRTKSGQKQAADEEEPPVPSTNPVQKKLDEYLKSPCESAEYRC